MKIILAQAPVKADKPSDNMETIQKVVASIKDRGVELLVFPRLVLSGYIGAEVLQRPAVVQQYRKVWANFLEFTKKCPEIIFSFSVYDFEEGDTLGAEIAVMLKNGELLYKQPRVLGTSLYPPENWPVLEIKDERVRVIIGDDIILPGASEEAEILITLKDFVYLGEAFEPKPFKNNNWYMNVSTVGGDGSLIYEGSTYMCDPTGDLKGWAQGFERALVEFNTKGNLGKLILPPRTEISVLYEALKVGLKDYIKHSGFSKVLLGVSGGIDSAVVAALAAEALGAENVLGVAMPSAYNPPESLKDASALTKNLKMPFLTLPINKIKDSFLSAFILETGSNKEKSLLAEENLQPRIRGTLLMYLSNRDDMLLLSPSNKSEMAIGYTTMYGDMCGALAPLADVYKTKVYELAQYINRKKEIIPQNIIVKAPSAELKPEQKDADTLPPYEELDDILNRFLEKKQSGSVIVKETGYSAMTVAWALSALKRFTFKRFQAPPVLQVSASPLPRNLG